MPLDEAQRSKIDGWLKEKNIKACPMCGGQPLQVLDTLYGLPKLERDKLDLVHGLEQVVVECHACGFQMPFHAWTLGLK